MNPRKLCKLLSKKAAYQVDQVLGLEVTDGSSDDLRAAGEPTWLDQNISEIVSVLANLNSSKQSAMVNSLESNAFLASFQRAYESESRSRTRKWASVFSQKRAHISEGGALTSLLTEIGTRANPEFIDKPSVNVGDEVLLKA